MNQPQSSEKSQISRRNFLQAADDAAASISFGSESGRIAGLATASAPSAAPPKEPAVVRGAFT